VTLPRCSFSRLAAFVTAAALVACGGSPPAATTPTPPADTTATPPPTDGAAIKPVVEGPTADETVAWVLATIEAGGKVSVADVEARFAPAFLAQVPAAKVVEIFGALAGQLPPIKVLKQEGEAPLKASALLDTAAGGVRVIAGMTKTTPRQIETLLFQPATSEAPPRTYGDAVAQLLKAGAKTQLFIGELAKGRCVARQEHQAADALAIGSSMKLWVLLALDEKLAKARGKLTWDTTLAIRDEAKSLPSGEMQDLAAGTLPTLREYATKMISISDNTATDHLIDFVGREAVETALKLAGHGKPALDIPFLRTRELFSLKLAATPEELVAYAKAKPAAKKKLLAELRGRPVSVETAIAEWKTPRHLELEWFATAQDLCKVMAELGDRGKLDPSSELLKILGKNPGVPFDAKQWTYVGFKGGSEPGVMNLTWLLRRTDGTWFVVVIGVNDETKAVDEGLVVNAAAGTLQILGAETAAAAPAAP